MTQNDNIVEGQIVENDEPKTPRFALPRTKTAYAIYGAGALLLIGGAAAAFFGRSENSDAPADTTVASDTETTND